MNLEAYAREGLEAVVAFNQTQDRRLLHRQETTDEMEARATLTATFGGGFDIEVEYIDSEDDDMYEYMSIPFPMFEAIYLAAKARLEAQAGVT